MALSLNNETESSKGARLIQFWIIAAVLVVLLEAWCN